MMTEQWVARAYDALAQEYDAQMEKNPVAAYMRARLYSHFARVFRTGDRVLDFTAGTGADSLFLATRGMQVTALDASVAMIGILQQAAGQRGLHVDARVYFAEHLGELREDTFDGAISTFAGMSTIHDLAQLANDLKALIKPHGHVIIHTLNAFCFWEWAANLYRGHPFQTRRIEMHIDGETVPQRLYNPFALWRDAFAACFELRQAYGLSIVAAPALLKRWPSLAQPLFLIDRISGRLFSAAGDFFVVDLERRDD